MSEQSTNLTQGAATPTPRRPVPEAPRYNNLPKRTMRTVRGGAEVCEIGVKLEVVTPILGGGFQTREIDDIDAIRAPTVRGHLRFWWRALYAHECATPSELLDRESALWGRAATDKGGRSAVEVRIEVVRKGGVDETDIDLQKTQGAYALWPARAERERKSQMPPARRRAPGTRFRLTVIVPVSRATEVKNALSAWILFGGYGSRTRRGLGSLTVVDDADRWLPKVAAREEFTRLFGVDIFAERSQAARDVPWLCGASIHVGSPNRDAMAAWTTALDWLKEFRQGTSGNQGDRAREPGTAKAQPSRPSISNWPEADKIRHLRQKTKAHPPRHNKTPAWPRAGFGLPIIGQFQKRSRDGGNFDEPDAFELHWRSGSTEHDRLASPLILKALPLAVGGFVPCALWLSRAYPAGEVVLRGKDNSEAPFDRLVAPGDAPKFSALANKKSLREAFLDWLKAKYETTVVSP